jgi:hypothetical protein
LGCIVYSALLQSFLHFESQAAKEVRVTAREIFTSAAQWQFKRSDIQATVFKAHDKILWSTPRRGERQHSKLNSKEDANKGEYGERGESIFY